MSEPFVIMLQFHRIRMTIENRGGNQKIHQRTDGVGPRDRGLKALSTVIDTDLGC